MNDGRPIADELNDLAELHRSGSLTDDEFASAKATLIAQRGDGSARRGNPIAYVLCAVTLIVVAAGVLLIVTRGGPKGDQVQASPIDAAPTTTAPPTTVKVLAESTIDGTEFLDQIIGPRYAECGPMPLPDASNPDYNQSPTQQIVEWYQCRTDIANRPFSNAESTKLEQLALSRRKAEMSSMCDGATTHVKFTITMGTSSSSIEVPCD